MGGHTITHNRTTDLNTHARTVPLNERAISPHSSLLICISLLATRRLCRGVWIKRPLLSVTFLWSGSHVVLAVSSSPTRPPPPSRSAASPLVGAAVDEHAVRCVSHVRLAPFWFLRPAPFLPISRPPSSICHWRLRCAKHGGTLTDASYAVRRHPPSVTSVLSSPQVPSKGCASRSTTSPRMRIMWRMLPSTSCVSASLTRRPSSRCCFIHFCFAPVVETRQNVVEFPFFMKRFTASKNRNRRNNP